MPPLPYPVQIALAAIVAIAALYDLRWRRIPNWLVLSGLCLGFGLHGYLFGWSGVARAAGGTALAGAIYLPLFALRAMGGGDVKLMLAAGSLAGAHNWLVIFLLTALLGGLAAIALLLIRGGLGRAFLNVGHILTELVHLRAPYRSAAELSVEHPHAVTMPHGAVIAAGTLMFLLLIRTGMLPQ
jgi:prepilin peptidase CpaA